VRIDDGKPNCRAYRWTFSALAPGNSRRDMRLAWPQKIKRFDHILSPENSSRTVLQAAAASRALL